MCTKVGWIIGAIIGIVLIALGFGAGYGLFPGIIDGQVETNLNFWDESTDARQNFERPLVDMYMRIWVFNVTNPDEVVAGIAKPNVQEIGPYVYREERRKKFRQQEYIDSSKIQYGQEKSYHFEPEMSCQECEFNATWTVINAPMVGITYVLRQDPLFANLLKVINKAITTGDYSQTKPPFEDVHNDAWLDTLFMKTTVDDFIFNGVIPGFLQFIFDNKMSSVGSQLPETVIDVETGFAALCNKNGSTKNEWYEAWTGTRDHLDQFLQINKWGQDENGALYEDLTRANWWTENGGINGSNACNLLKGSDGQQFPPFVKNDDIFHVFASDICRTIFVTYQNEQDIDGIKALRFSPPTKAFQVNTTTNVGFCMEIEKNVPWDECYKEVEGDPEIYDLTNCFNHVNYTGRCHDGLLDVTKCKQQAPGIISNPHFYQVSLFKCPVHYIFFQFRSIAYALEGILMHEQED